MRNFIVYRIVFACLYLTSISFSVQALEYPEEMILTDVYEGLTRMYGVNPGDHTGASIDLADINGDGFDDIIIGTDQGDALLTRPQSGAVYVYFGGADFFVSPEYFPMCNPEPMQLIWGSEGYEHCGYKINHGDFNADGIADLMIGAVGTADVPGKLHILMGSSNIRDYRYIDLSTDDVPVVTIHGRSPGGQLGFACDSGDFNGDGIDDILVGAPYAGEVAIQDDLEQTVPTGEAYIISGDPSFFDTDNINIGDVSSNIQVLTGEQPADAFGIGITAGDLNDDGYDDAIIGAWTSDRFPFIENAGRVYVYWGGPESINGQSLIAGTLDDRWFQIVGENGMFGHNIFTGDLNNDGISDLIAGAHVYDYAVADTLYSMYSRDDCGALYCIYGDPSLKGPTHIDLADTSYPVLSVVGAENGDHCAIGIVADVNSDGIPDLIAAAPEAKYMDYYALGIAHVIWGPFEKDTETIDMRVTTRSYSSIYAEYEGGGFCRNNIEAGDINGDGLTDIALPCILGDPLLRYNAGLVYALSGDQSNFTFIPKPPVQVVEQQPQTISLLPNYPNPFNPTTAIPFTLQNETRVSLAVYNILGERIAELVDGNYPAGSHEIVWDASGVSSGVYFSRLEAAGIKQTQRMMLVR